MKAEFGMQNSEWLAKSEEEIAEGRKELEEMLTSGK